MQCRLRLPRFKRYSYPEAYPAFCHRGITRTTMLSSWQEAASASQQTEMLERSLHFPIKPGVVAAWTARTVVIVSLLRALIRSFTESLRC